MKQNYQKLRNRGLSGLTPVKKKMTIVSILSMMIFSISFCQQGIITGKIVDKATREPIPFANIKLYMDTTMCGGNTSDLDGKYCIQPVNQGIYDLKVTYVGYKSVTLENLVVNADQITFSDIELVATSEMLPEIVITDFHVPLINKDCSVSGGAITSSEIRPITNKKANSVAITVGGVFSADGERGNVRGSISSQTVMYIDGIRVLGSYSLPHNAVEHAGVLVDEVPAGSTHEYYSGSAKKYSPKMLTAGEINDFSKWKLWNDIAKDDLSEYSDQWEIYPMERFCVQIMNQQNFPVVDCKVTLFDESGNILWNARTDNTGKAELWANLFQSSEDNKTSCEIKIDNNGETFVIKKPKVFQQGINSVKLDKECQPNNVVDILFTVDATGSMGDEIEYLKVELLGIIEKFAAGVSNLELRLGSVFYRDTGDEYVTKKSELSADINKTIQFIKQQNACGGGDGPEAVDDALFVSIKDLNWSNNSRARIMFMILDAPPHKVNEKIIKLKESIKSAAANGIRIIPIVCSGGGYNHDKSLEYLMRSIALATNGTYVFLTDDSGIGNPHTKPSIDSYDVEMLYDLIIRLLKQYTFVNECTETSDPEVIIDSLPINIPDSVEVNNSIVDSVNVAGGIGDEPGQSWLNAYPNPTGGRITVDIPKNKDEIFLVDLNGKIIMRKLTERKKHVVMDLSDLPNGLYFLKVDGENQWEYFKIVVNR